MAESRAFVPDQRQQRRAACNLATLGAAVIVAGMSIALPGCVVTDDPPPDPNAPPVELSQPAPVQPGVRSPDDYGRPSSNPPGVPANVAGDPDRKDVPVDARLVTEGKGTLEFRAVRDGLIFVVDADTDTLVFRGQINRNEVFRFSPDGNDATINGRKVLKVDLKRKDKHKIFFLRD